MAVNSVTLIGRLVRDPDVKTVGDKNTALCRFTLAVDKRGKDAGTNFISCTAWGKTGEVIGKYVKKGNQFGITGHLDQHSWEKDGEKQYQLDVIVDEFTFISGGEKTPSEQFGLYDKKEKEEPEEEIDLSSIPF